MCTMCCFLYNFLGINVLHATLLYFNVLRMCCFIKNVLLVYILINI